MSKINKHAVKTISLITIITIVSKTFGFLRDALIAANFGSSTLADSYFAVAGVTVLLAELIVNAALTIVIPVLTEVKKEKGKQGTYTYVGKFATLIFLTTMILTLLGILFAPFIIRIIASGFTLEQTIFAMRLLRWGLPSIVCSGIVGVFAGYLQSENRFLLASSTRMIFNSLCILYLIFFSEKYGLVGLMMMTVTASIVQFIAVRISVKRLGYYYQFSLTFKDEYIKQAIRLSLPVFLGIAIYDINNLVDRSFASKLDAGTISNLTYASKLEALIIGIFVTAIMTYFYPIFAKSMKVENANIELKENVTKAINLNIILAIPATIGLMILAEPIVQMMFQRGAFHSKNTIVTAGILRFYALAIFAKAMREVAIRLFYILQFNKIALRNGLLMILLNFVLNMLVISRQNVNEIAFTTSLSVILTTFILFYQLWKKAKVFAFHEIGICLLKTTIAAGIMGAFTFIGWQQIRTLELMQENIFVLLLISLLILFAVIIYFITLSILGLKEIKEILQMLKKEKA